MEKQNNSSKDEKLVVQNLGLHVDLHVVERCRDRQISLSHLWLVHSLNAL